MSSFLIVLMLSRGELELEKQEGKIKAREKPVVNLPQSRKVFQHISRIETFIGAFDARPTLLKSELIR